MFAPAFDFTAGQIADFCRQHPDAPCRHMLAEVFIYHGRTAMHRRKGTCHHQAAHRGIACVLQRRKRHLAFTLDQVPGQLQGHALVGRAPRGKARQLENVRVLPRCAAAGGHGHLVAAGLYHGDMPAFVILQRPAVRIGKRADLAADDSLEFLLAAANFLGRLVVAAFIEDGMANRVTTDLEALAVQGAHRIAVEGAWPDQRRTRLRLDHFDCAHPFGQGCVFQAFLQFRNQPYSAADLAQVVVAAEAIGQARPAIGQCPHCRDDALVPQGRPVELLGGDKKCRWHVTRPERRADRGQPLVVAVVEGQGDSLFRQLASGERSRAVGKRHYASVLLQEVQNIFKLAKGRLGRGQRIGRQWHLVEQQHGKPGMLSLPRQQGEQAVGNPCSHALPFAGTAAAQQR